MIRVVGAPRICEPGGVGFLLGAGGFRGREVWEDPHVGVRLLAHDLPLEAEALDEIHLGGDDACWSRQQLHAHVLGDHYLLDRQPRLLT